MLRAGSAALALVIAAGTAAGAQVMTAEATREFVAGRFFHYSCFDGTSGAGRIFADGSAIGTLQSSARGNVRHIALPVGTLFVKNDRICANLKGLYFEPCFTITKTGTNSFRGSINGMSFMSCEFNSQGRTQIARKRSPRTGVLAGAGMGVP